MDSALPFLVYLSSRVQTPVKTLQPLGGLSGPITFNIFNYATLKKNTNPSVEMLPAVFVCSSHAKISLYFATPYESG